MKIDLTEEELKYLLGCLKWNKYNFEQKPFSECMNKQEVLDKMSNLINKIKLGAKKCRRNRV